MIGTPWLVPVPSRTSSREGDIRTVISKAPHGEAEAWRMGFRRDLCSVANERRNPQSLGIHIARSVSHQACPKRVRRRFPSSGHCKFLKQKLTENKRIAECPGILRAGGTMVASGRFGSKRLRHDRRTDAINCEDSRAVASTKGRSAGGVAGDGPMAVAGRAPMLPADYSFFDPNLAWSF